MSDKTKGILALIFALTFPVFAFFLHLSQSVAQDTGLTLMGVSLRPTNTPTPTATPTATPTPAGFDANSYCTVAAWWDFSDTTKVLEAAADPAEDTDGIQFVTTKGTSPIGGDASQATSGDRPVVAANVQNGLQVARFNGTSHFMQLTTGRDTTNGEADMSFVVVYQKDDNTSSRALFEFQDGGGGHRLKFYHEFNPNQWTVDTKRLDAGSAQNFYSGGGNTTAAATWYIAVGLVNHTGDEMDLWINGVQKINGTFTGDGAWSSTNSAEDPVLGANSLYDSQLFDGDIGEIIICSDLMDTTARDNLETALGTKWNITVS